jgi:hypothetical protein
MGAFLNALKTIVKQTGRLRLEQAVYTATFNRLDEEMAQRADRRRCLRDALDAVQSAGAIRFPGSAAVNWDRAGATALPRFITLQREADVCPAREIFVPDLAFASRVRPSNKLDLLITLNRYLIAHTDPDEFETLAKYRERAFQIFGDEKALDDAVKGDLLWGQLPLERIGAMNPENLTLERFPRAQDRPVLIVENRQTYLTLCDWNRSACAYRIVCFGAGFAIVSQVKALIQMPAQDSVVGFEYFGDLDPTGVNIANTLDLKLQDEAHERVRPALHLYSLILGQKVRKALAAPKILSCSNIAWLDPLKTEVQALFDANTWIPQEALRLEMLG